MARGKVETDIEFYCGNALIDALHDFLGNPTRTMSDAPPMTETTAAYSIGLT